MTMANLYTFVVDYNGGTYISQITSTSIDDAIYDWAKTYNFLEMTGKDINRNRLIQKIEKSEELPVPLDGLTNVWCTTLILNRKFALLNVILTVKGKR